MAETIKKPPAHEVILDRLRHHTEKLAGDHFNLHSAVIQEFCLVLTQMSIPAAERKGFLEKLLVIELEAQRVCNIRLVLPGDLHPGLAFYDAYQTLLGETSDTV